MADIFTKKKRSEVMSKVRNKDSKLEMILRKILWKKGMRYRKNVGEKFGKPDLVFAKYKTVIFIDSCFWHGCKVHGSIPQTRKNFWTKKLKRNKERDGEVSRYYKKNDWQVIRMWEHDLKDFTDKEAGQLIEKIKENI